MPSPRRSEKPAAASTPPVIVWFRQDLRLADHAGLTAAIEAGGPVIPVYVLDDAGAGAWAMGGASRWWLHGSLMALEAGLRARGSRLILRRGDTVEVLLQLAGETGARTIHCSRAFEPSAAQSEDRLKTACGAPGITLRRFRGSLLVEPEMIHTQTGDPFRVFTPFWRSLQGVVPVRANHGAPEQLPAPPAWPASEEIAAWSLTPRKPNWAHGLAAEWSPGEAGAMDRMSVLLSGPLAAYGQARDRPDLAGTSMLSPHLHFGEISASQCWQAVRMAAERNPALSRGAAVFLRELAWREFSGHLLHHWPSLPERPFRPEFEAFPWEGDANRAKSSFAAWTRGATGYPIVDAGMRQLWRTGWMHNRVRMIVASFLTKHLRLPWQSGARWFWETLVDADLANNSASWQWVAGSGADAAPYFRIFNPVLQGLKFDTQGTYVRRFVPELSQVPAEHIHAPWNAPDAVLVRAEVRLGETYPRPIVDHAAARHAALEAYAALKNGRRS